MAIPADLQQLDFNSVVYTALQKQLYPYLQKQYRCIDTWVKPPLICAVVEGGLSLLPGTYVRMIAGAATNVYAIEHEIANQL